MKEKYQNLILTMDDGTQHVFTGKAFVYPKDAGKRTIQAIAFTVPKGLPAGMTFEEPK